MDCEGCVRKVTNAVEDLEGDLLINISFYPSVI